MRDAVIRVKILVGCGMAHDLVVQDLVGSCRRSGGLAEFWWVLLGPQPQGISAVVTGSLTNWVNGKTQKI